MQLAAVCGKQALAARRVPLEAIDLAILGITNPQRGGFYGLPWLTGMMGLDRVPGPTIQQACATSVRALQMASHEVRDGSSQCTFARLMADRQSNGPVYLPPTRRQRRLWHHRALGARQHGARPYARTP